MEKILSQLLKLRQELAERPDLRSAIQSLEKTIIEVLKPYTGKKIKVKFVEPRQRYRKNLKKDATGKLVGTIWFKPCRIILWENDNEKHYEISLIQSIKPIEITEE